MKTLPILAALHLTSGCSSAPQPTPTPVPAPVDQAWLQVKGVLDAHCSPCHNGETEPKLAPKDAFKALAGAVKARVSAGTMPPPPAKLSDGDKNVLLAFIAGLI